jgi:hypothetical protein
MRALLGKLPRLLQPSAECDWSQGAFVLVLLFAFQVVDLFKLP